MSTASGQGVLSVALLQDIAAIPILALLPLLARGLHSGSAGAYTLLLDRYIERGGYKRGERPEHKSTKDLEDITGNPGHRGVTP